MRSRLSQILPWLKVLAAQFVAFAAMAWLASFWPLGDIWHYLLQGVLAMGVAIGLALPRHWIVAQLFLPLAFVYGAYLPSWIWLGAFVIVALLYWNSASERVPLYLTNRRTWESLADIVAAENATSMVDLGSGFGGVVRHLAATNSGLSARGVETAPLAYLAARSLALVAGPKNARFFYRSLWEEDLAAHDIVYCFLSPAPMPKLYEKARAEMSKGSLLVSNSFVVPDVAPDQVIEVDDTRHTRLFLYRM